MSSDKESDQNSSTDTSRPPQSPLPGEDPNLVVQASSRVSGHLNASGREIHVGGNVAGRDVYSETTPNVGSRERKVPRARAGLFLALIVLGALLYFILQYIFR